jgi:hypothetical protein
MLSGPSHLGFASHGFRAPLSMAHALRCRAAVEMPALRRKGRVAVLPLGGFGDKMRAQCPEQFGVTRNFTEAFFFSKGVMYAADDNQAHV